MFIFAYPPPPDNEQQMAKNKMAEIKPCVMCKYEHCVGISLH